MQEILLDLNLSPFFNVYASLENFKIKIKLLQKQLYKVRSSPSPSITEKYRLRTGRRQILIPISTEISPENLKEVATAALVLMSFGIYPSNYEAEYLPHYSRC